MDRRLSFEVTKRTRLKDKGFFKVDLLDIRRERFDGGFDDIKREVPDRGDAVAILAYDPIRDVVMLGRELRSGILYRDEYPFTLALPAGGMKPGEDPIECAQREMAEEQGLQLGQPKLIFNQLYNSAGGSSERLSIVFGIVAAPLASRVLGLASEHENILTVAMPAKEFIRISGGFDRSMPDMMTTLSAEWLKQHRTGLRLKASGARALNWLKRAIPHTSRPSA